MFKCRLGDDLRQCIEAPAGVKNIECREASNMRLRSLSTPPVTRAAVRLIDKRDTLNAGM